MLYSDKGDDEVQSTTNGEMTMTSNDSDDTEEEKGNEKKKKKITIVGAGWGGWGAAKALCEATATSTVSVEEYSYEITLIDALPDPTGVTPYLSSSGKPVEAGTRGFWKDYPNINTLCTDYLNLDENDVFTPFTNSSFYSPDGLEVGDTIENAGF